MNSIDEYIDKAKELNGFQSDRELSRTLGKSHVAVNHWRTKRTWPSEETMLELANLAQVNPEIALVDLGIWRSEGHASVVYSHLKELLEQMPSKLMNFIAFATLPAFFDMRPAPRGDR